MKPYDAAVAFFKQHAGFSYSPSESPAHGRLRCARMLASAERKAVNGGFSYSWSVDPDITSADWIDDNDDGGRNCKPWDTWQCVMYNRHGQIVNSLHGIDFGRGGEPWGDPYKRVAEAELALEGLTNTPRGRGRR